MKATIKNTWGGGGGYASAPYVQIGALFFGDGDGEGLIGEAGIEILAGKIVVGLEICFRQTGVAKPAHDAGGMGV